MKEYLSLLHDILINGKDHEKDRTGHGRRRVFGRQVRFDLSDNKIPIVTTRKINPNVFIQEIFFFIRGKMFIDELKEAGVHIWDPWAVTRKTIEKDLEENPASTEDTIDNVVAMYEDSIGPMYGFLWRHWPRNQQPDATSFAGFDRSTMASDSIKDFLEARSSLPEETQAQIPEDMWLHLNSVVEVDQLNDLIRNLKRDPYGSRHVVTAFNPEYTPLPGVSPDQNVLRGRGCLMPCHFAFQVFVEPPDTEGEKPKLSLQMNIRSWDVPVGGPFNIAGYGLLAHLLAYSLDMDAKELVICSGDTHIYLDQIAQVQEQLRRQPLASPTLRITSDTKDFFQLKPENVEILDYEPHPPIKYPVAV